MHSMHWWHSQNFQPSTIIISTTERCSKQRCIQRVPIHPIHPIQHNPTYRLISPRILNPLGGWKKVLKTIIFWRLPLFRSVVLRLGTFRSHDPKRYGELWNNVEHESTLNKCLLSVGINTSPIGCVDTCYKAIKIGASVSVCSEHPLPAWRPSSSPSPWCCWPSRAARLAMWPPASPALQPPGVPRAQAQVP